MTTKNKGIREPLKYIIGCTGCTSLTPET